MNDVNDNNLSKLVDEHNEEDTESTKKESLQETMSKLLAEYETDADSSATNEITASKNFESLSENNSPSLRLKELPSERSPLTATMEPSYSRETQMPLMQMNNQENVEATMNTRESELSIPLEESFDYDESESEGLEDLDILLQGMPKQRIAKIKEEFLNVLGTPSMLRLVPILRENMPEFMTTGWLKKKNLTDAQIVMRKAKADGVVDIHILNNMLEVMTTHGNLGAAVDFHEEKYAEKGMTPTTYSDRLVLQMLIQNNRLSRALSFKQKVESQGRKLDLLSYGSLTEHYADKEQLGSALMTLKECISIHGVPPGEKSLTKIRSICRRDELEEKVGIEELIGPDPISWLRHGERNLKREYTKKGRRGVLFPRQKLVQV